MSDECKIGVLNRLLHRKCRCKCRDVALNGYVDGSYSETSCDGCCHSQVARRSLLTGRVSFDR
jgi:hypothetical protein